MCENIKPIKELDTTRYGHRNDPIERKHSYDHPHRGVTVAYHRDRGENKQIGVFGSYEEWVSHWGREVSYLYLFKDGKWYSEGKLLSVAIAEEEKELEEED